MKEYLATLVGTRMSVIREGFPGEVEITGTIVRVADGVVVMRGDDGGETALPVERILAVAPPETPPPAKAGFR